MATTAVSQNFIRMMRDDFVRLLRSPDRLSYPFITDRRLARDLEALGGLMGEW